MPSRNDDERNRPLYMISVAAELTGMWGHPDQDEGPRAFVEKRAANWQ